MAWSTVVERAFLSLDCQPAEVFRLSGVSVFGVIELGAFNPRTMRECAEASGGIGLVNQFIDE